MTRPDGSRRRAARPGADAGPTVRHLRPRAVLRHPLRILRLQHLHARRAGRREPRRLAGGAARPSWRWPRATGSASPPARATPCSSAAERRRCSAAPAWRRCSTRSASTSRWRPTPRSPPRRTRSRRRRELFAAAARGRLHPGVAGHAVGGAARARGAGPGALAGPGARRRRARPARPASSTSTST